MTENKIDLATPHKIHLVGVGGAGISAIGIILATMGHEVSGVDLNETPAWSSLMAAGVKVAVADSGDLFGGSDATNAEVVAHSTAFIPTDHQRANLENQGVQVLNRAEILALICAQKRTIAVSGTHGKTSTTAMLATLLEGVGAQPSFLVGALPLGLGRAASWGGSGPFVVEADESDGSFLSLGADVAIVNNIDADHMDYWQSMERLEAAFDQFVADAQEAVVCIDDTKRDAVAEERALRVARKHGALSVGESQEARLRVHNVAVNRLETTFGLSFDGTEIGPVKVATPGRHNARNAAVAIAVAIESGISPSDAVGAIAAYRGSSRRFEVVGEFNGATVVDDYAHNPGKVRSVLSAAKEAGWDRVVVLFQPHRYSRTKNQAREFGEALSLADVVGVSEIYAAGEAPIEGVSAEMLIAATLDERPSAIAEWLPTLDDAENWIRSQARPGDLVLTVGAGDIWRVGRSIVDSPDA